MRRGPRILVADDEPNFNQVLRAELERRGYQAFAAYDGQEALAAIRELGFDLVLLDFRLPHTDDGDALRGMREARPDLPVIVMTAYDSAEARAGAQEADAEGYVVKPFDVEDLLDMVAAALAKHSGAAPVEVDAEMVLALVKRGQAMTLEVSVGEHAGQYEVWAEAQPGTAVAVSMPRSGGRSVRIPLRTEVLLSVGLSGGCYQFESVVVGLSVGSERPTLLLQRPTVAWCEQRRRYPRHDMRFPVVCHVLHGNTDRAIEAEAENLSLGGLRLASSLPIERGAQVKVEATEAPGRGPLSRVGRVVWTTREESETVRYCAGIQFVDPPRSAAEGADLR